MGTAAEHLLLDANGAIKGIIAADEGGQVKINCQAVMLACGGFGQNDELLKKYCRPDFLAAIRCIVTPCLGIQVMPLP